MVLCSSQQLRHFAVKMPQHKFYWNKDDLCGRVMKIYSCKIELEGSKKWTPDIYNNFTADYYSAAKMLQAIWQFKCPHVNAQPYIRVILRKINLTLKWPNYFLEKPHKLSLKWSFANSNNTHKINSLSKYLHSIFILFNNSSLNHS